MSAYPTPASTHLPPEQTLRLALGLLLGKQGWDSDQIDLLLIRLPAQSPLYETRYPLADASLPLPARMAADERTLNAARREVVARIAANQ